MSAARKLELLHAVDPYNQYVLKKLETNRSDSLTRFVGTKDLKELKQERENFVRIFNLKGKYSPNSPEVARCVEIIHQKYKIDVTHGLQFIKNQWVAENGGTPESLARATLLRECNPISQIMFVAKKINAVNQVAMCDDFRRYWTLTFLLIETANPRYGITMERLQEAIMKGENRDVMPVGRAPNQERVFANANQAAQDQAVGQSPFEDDN